MPQGQHEDMPAGVGVGVHDDEGLLAPPHHEVVLRGRTAGRQPAEDAVGLVVGDAPGPLALGGFHYVLASPPGPEVVKAHGATRRPLMGPTPPAPCPRAGPYAPPQPRPP